MKIKPLFYLIVFSSFFISGLLLAMGNETQTAQLVQNGVQTKNPLGTLPEKQLNVLVIGVEEVGATDTILKGVWLILVPPGGETLSFIPIYPQHAESGSAGYGLPHEAVRLDASTLQKATQLDMLKKQNTWWDEVVLLDEQGLFDLYQLIGSVDIIQTSLAEVYGETGKVNSWENPTAALFNQAALIQKMCAHGALFSFLANGGNISSPFSAHLLRSTTEVDIIEFSYILALAVGNFDCQFPTLE